MAGACPDSVLATLGEGKLAVLPTLAGLMLGTWLYGLFPEVRKIGIRKRPGMDAREVL
ncbi:MAG: hypothetical protein M0R77_05525 [Gammaproteobacteria bacterium]|nr:hypothetical protein [Gammaproteobacteria bacterium]